MGVKESLGDSKKFLLLAVGLLVISFVIMFAMKSGFYDPSEGIVDSGDTFTEPENVLEVGIDYSIRITTVYGDILIDLYEDKAPENVNSLLFLMGERYYDGLTFYKVINSYVIQTGDTKGDGSSNPGYTVSKENLVSFSDYSVGMANASQFFIVLEGSSKEDFNGEYSIVGRVTEGFAVLDSIGKVEVDDDYRPVNDVIIKSIQIIEE